MRRKPTGLVGSALRAPFGARKPVLAAKGERPLSVRSKDRRLVAEPLVYLCVSTMHGAEIVEYPDSGKVGVGVADLTSPVGFRRIGLFRAGSGTLDYWEGEPEAGSG